MTATPAWRGRSSGLGYPEPMKVAAYEAPLLAAGSMDALDLMQERVAWCEAERVSILCCPEAILGGLVGGILAVVCCLRGVRERNRVGMSYGASGIVDPDGNVLQQAKLQSIDVLVADIETSPQARQRGSEAVQ